MQQNDALSKLWEDQISRITPQAEQSEFNDLLQLITSRIQEFIEKLFNLGKAIHAPGITPRMFVIILVAIFVSIAGIILWRRYSLFIKAAFRSFRLGESFSEIHARYLKLVSDGLYAQALRAFVKSVSDSSNQRTKTFSEIFSVTDAGPLITTRDQYGETIHLDHPINRESLEQFEKEAVELYPQYSKILQRKSKP
jgi:hypothetical protein